MIDEIGQLKEQNAWLRAALSQLAAAGQELIAAGDSVMMNRWYPAREEMRTALRRAHSIIATKGNQE